MYARTNAHTWPVQGSDYLLCQLAADKKLSTLESLPAEILEPILEDVSIYICYDDVECRYALTSSRFN